MVGRILRWAAMATVPAFFGCHFGDSLDVTQSSPSGDLYSTPAYVEVQFDRPILDPDKPNAKVPSLEIRTEPEIPGTVSFPTPSSLTFSFDAAPPPATRVTVTIESGLRSFDGSAVLKSDHSFSFTTERNRMENVTVAAASREESRDTRTRFAERGDRKSENLNLQDELIVALRFPAKIDELERLVKVTGTPMAGGAARPLEFVLHVPEEDSGLGVDRFLVRPKEIWPKHTHLDVTLATGLQVALDGAGRKGSSEVQRLRVSTYGPIDIKKGPEC
ncbi:MAG: Ig-like domain-containing protein, partial [Myxococcota bacterium]